MRTIDEIKESITDAFMRNEDVARAYEFKAGDDFSAHFSKVSIENVLFYIFACSAWVLENLFDAHKKEVSDRIEAIIPHRPKWYRDKVLDFMKDKSLISGTDKYDTIDMSQAAIEAAHVIKHAVATESKDSSMLVIKVAGENGGHRCPVDSDTEKQLAAYIAEIKDAGVRIKLVNAEADTFNCSVDVYYDPMKLPTTLELVCRQSIRNYIENLPFNGEYTNMALVDELQKVEGVRIVEFKGATTAAWNETNHIPINARYIPTAGYFSLGTVTINCLPHEQV